jgi:hypothetical protein
VLPWLITTSGWPALTARFAGATARVAVGEATVTGVSAGALALAGVLLVRSRVRGRPGERST